MWPTPRHWNVLPPEEGWKNNQPWNVSAEPGSMCACFIHHHAKEAPSLAHPNSTEGQRWPAESAPQLGFALFYSAPLERTEIPVLKGNCANRTQEYLYSSPNTSTSSRGLVDDLWGGNASLNCTLDGAAFQEWRATHHGCLFWRALREALPRWSQLLLGTQNDVLPFHALSPALIKSTHHRRPFSFYLFPRRALPCTFQTQDTKQETELGFVYRNSLLEYKELLVIITEECWLIPGALQYSWGIIIDFSFLPTGIVLVISHCSCKVRRLMLLKSHLGSSCGRCCTM